MKFNKTVVSAAIVAALGCAAFVTTTSASAGVLSAGNWGMEILVTPARTTSYGGTVFTIGKDGAYNSSFSLGGVPSSGFSQGMTDTAATAAGNGSGVVDGFAGTLGLSVDASGNITAPGTEFTGTNAGNGLTLTTTNRRASINGIAGFTNLPWNIDDLGGFDASGNPVSNGATAYTIFSTGSASAILPGGAGAATINGAGLTSIGDVDGDGINDYSAVLVSGGRIGSSWASFFGATFFETWSINLLSNTSFNGFSKDTIFGTGGGDFAQAAVVSSVPVPAAVWLFSSGLVGLGVMMGAPKRRKG